LKGAIAKMRKCAIEKLVTQFRKHTFALGRLDRGRFSVQAATASRSATHSRAAVSLIRTQRPILNVLGASPRFTSW
jgi:hypothetical protein